MLIVSYDVKDEGLWLLIYCVF